MNQPAWMQPQPPYTPQQLRAIAHACRELSTAFERQDPEMAGHYLKEATWFEDEARKLEQ